MGGVDRPQPTKAEGPYYVLRDPVQYTTCMYTYPEEHSMGLEALDLGRFQSLEYRYSTFEHVQYFVPYYLDYLGIRS